MQQTTSTAYVDSFGRLLMSSGSHSSHMTGLASTGSTTDALQKRLAELQQEKKRLEAQIQYNLDQLSKCGGIGKKSCQKAKQGYIERDKALIATLDQEITQINNVSLPAAIAALRSNPEVVKAETEAKVRLFASEQEAKGNQVLIIGVLAILGLVAGVWALKKFLL